MRANGKIQLAPLLRIALALVLGIWMADITAMPCHLWAITAVVFTIAVFIARSHPVAQSSLLMATTICIGGLLLSTYNKTHDSSLPENKLAYKAVVSSRPYIKGRTLRCDLTVTEIGNTLLERPLNVRATIMTDSNDTRWKNLKMGAGIEAVSRLKAPANFSKEFNYVRWMRCHGYDGQTFIAKGHWTAANVHTENMGRKQKIALTIQMAADKFRSRHLEQKDWGNNDTETAIINAMTIGDKSALDSNMKEEFSISGASHILALSGLHLSIIYGLLTMALRRRLRRNALVMTMVLTFIWAYVLMVGMPVSIIRAATMLTIYSIASIINRNKMSLNALALTVIIILASNPLALWDVGFQLSVMAVAAIMVFNRHILQLYRPRTMVGTWIWGLISVSLSAQIGTAPLVALYFGRFSCYFLFVNIIVIPLTILIIYGTLLSWIIATIVTPSAVTTAVSWIAGVMYKSIKWIAGLPFASIENIEIEAWHVLAFYSIMVMVAFAIKRERNTL